MNTQILTSPQLIYDVDYHVWNGNYTRFVYQGPPTVGAFQFARCFRGEMRNCEIVIDSPGVDNAVLITDLASSNAGTGRVSSGCTFRNVRVYHGNSPHCARRAFGIDSFALGGIDKNNDHVTFEDCTAGAYSEAGFYVRGTQCHQISLVRCGASDELGQFINRPRSIGYHFELGVFFTARDCSANSNLCDFVIKDAQIGVGIYNFNSEHSNQLFRDDGGAYAESLISIDQVRWDGQPIDGIPVIFCRSPGPVLLRGLGLAGNNGVCPKIVFGGGSGFVGDVLTPLKGTADLSSIVIAQHGGASSDLENLITIPSTWAVKQFGLSWLKVLPDGGRERADVSVSTAA